MSASPTAIARQSCPTDPREVVAVLHHALTLAVRWKADGTAHIRSCLAGSVNAIPVACSDKCMEVQVSMLWGETWLARAPSVSRPARRQQAGLFEGMEVAG